jgi:hypothetical protein
LTGLKNDGKPKQEKDQPINKIDHGSVDQEKIGKSDHLGEIVA